jgi:hypothetical protein
MKYCTHCGNEIVDEAVVCTKCGCAVGQIIQSSSGVGSKFIGGLVTLILGIVGLIFSLVTISSDMKPSGFMGLYLTYRPPLTEHEVMMIAILIISIIVAIVGGIILIIGFSKKPNNSAVNYTSNPTVNNTSDSKKDGQAIASLISGVIGLSLLPVIGSIVGIITGIFGLKSAKRNLAIAGLITSIIGLVVYPIVLFYFISKG